MKAASFNRDSATSRDFAGSTQATVPCSNATGSRSTTISAPYYCDTFTSSAGASAPTKVPPQANRIGPAVQPSLFDARGEALLQNLQRELNALGAQENKRIASVIEKADESCNWLVRFTGASGVSKALLQQCIERANTEFEQCKSPHWLLTPVEQIGGIIEARLISVDVEYSMDAQLLETLQEVQEMNGAQGMHDMEEIEKILSLAIGLPLPTPFAGPTREPPYAASPPPLLEDLVTELKDSLDQMSMA